VSTWREQAERRRREALRLHQANLSMNHLIVKLLGREATEEEAPVILDTYANTSSPVR
jgi:3-oxoacyl-[acyl-carrier-protein] synthase III